MWGAKSPLSFFAKSRNVGLCCAHYYICRGYGISFKIRFGGSTKFENLLFYLSLRSPFTIFVEYRSRLGIVKAENYVFYLPLLSPFAIFANFVIYQNSYCDD